ncbi:unnamed protein product [marine sediment metagenome]|uniref:Resolvase/invertase-type recombinase catalytic domain-containing protein n=1 Tax=marine sediment metagenome TaxID=412755 RepID=X0ZRQ7_9ZZZZ
MKAIGYIRVSTEEQAKEGISLDNQTSKIKAYCESQDWQLVKVFSDEGSSGKDMKREGLKNLVSFLEADHVDVVVVYKTDRLTRKQRHLYQLLEDNFEKKGIGFKSVTEPFNTTTAMGKGFLGMLGVFAQLEGDLISERTKEALRYKISRGEPVGSPPLGFEAIKNKLKKNDDELEIVAEIFKLNNNHWGKNKLSLREIAKKLNSSGFRTKKNKDFSHKTVSYILSNPVYSSLLG